jgi:uncharacterized membrane protein YfhO
MKEGEINMRTNHDRWTVFFGASLIVLFAHAYYIWRFTQGYLMVGFGDGLSQMLTFKQYILQQYTAGHFTYAQNFGFGGGIFAQLNYYYMTNIFVFPWFLIFLIWPFETTVHTWTWLLIPMSMLKQLAIFFAGYYFLRYFTNTKNAAFLGATLLILNPFFFKNQIMVDMLADVLFWVPLTLIGVEKIIRNQSARFFTISCALLLISNFYIAYIIVLIIVAYIMLRMCIRIDPYERPRFQQLKWYVCGGLLGVGISSFAFFPAASAFLETERPPYTAHIPLFEAPSNLLLASSTSLWIPVFLCVFLLLPLYHHVAFRLFAIISIVGTILYFSPMIGSIFNGFSAPNTRWTPIIILGYAGVTAIAVDQFAQLRKRHWLVSIGLTAVFIFTLSFLTHTLREPLIVLSFSWLMIAVFGYKTARISSVLLLLIYANMFQAQLFPKTKLSTTTFTHSEDFAGEEVRDMLHYLNDYVVDAETRIDFSKKFRENIPFIHDVNGFSMYSSIINGDVMYMYMRDLQIDTGRESVSRFRSLGDRTNLLSLFRTQYYMRDRHYKNVPYSYTPIKTSKHFTAYENHQLMPAFRVVDTFYNVHTLNTEPTLAREHAMLNGVITDKGSAPNPQVSPIQPLSIKITNGIKNGEFIQVPKKSPLGRLTLKLPKSKAKTLYVQMTVEPIAHTRPFKLRVNDYKTIRRPKGDRYATGYNALTIAIPATETIKIKLSKGEYKLTDVAVYAEHYDVLHKAVQTAQAAPIHWDNERATGTVRAKQGDMLVTPIPFEKGWHAYVNGKKVAIEKVNYAFIGLPLQKGQNNVVLRYKTPTWTVTVPLSIVSFGIWLLWTYRRTTKKLPS